MHILLLHRTFHYRLLYKDSNIYELQHKNLNHIT